LETQTPKTQEGRLVKTVPLAGWVEVVLQIIAVMKQRQQKTSLKNRNQIFAKTMKAVRIHDYGSSDELVEDRVPRPVPGLGQVLVKIRAAGVNPVDTEIRQGEMQSFWSFDLPLILGTDVAGVIESLGGNKVRGLKVGDEIYGDVDMSVSGGYAEYGIAHLDQIAKKPKSLSFEEAAALPVITQTALQGLRDYAGLKKGQRILIHGGAGGVGSFAIQFAKLMGAYAITTASKRDFKFVQELGVDEVWDYHEDAFDVQIQEPVDVVFDLIGGDTRAKSWKILKKGGTLVATTDQPSEKLAKKARVRAVMMEMESRREDLEKIARLFDSGKIHLRLAKVLPLRQAKQAHELLAQHKVHGKLVLKV
jgi:NADPH:quinone reductase-like Zn-dependent oxidoreductase